MNNKSTSKTFNCDAPITQSDIKNGELILRKRAADGSILSNKHALQGESIETPINKTIREDMRSH